MQTLVSLGNCTRLAIMLSLVDLIIGNIAVSKGFDTAADSVNKCNEWFLHKTIEADDLYEYLENLDETGVLSFAALERDTMRRNIWMCIGNALVYTIWMAYNYEGREYLPETIESVDDDTINQFAECFSQVYPNGDLLIQKLTRQFSSYSDTSISLSEVKALAC